MAFSGLTSPVPTPLQLLLDEIKFQQQKELQFASRHDSSGFLTRGTTFWTDLFVRHFLFQADRSIDADDLLFFIRKKHIRNHLTLPKFQTSVDVYRKDSKKLPIGDPEISWSETVMLNLLIHHLEYTLTLAICTRTSPKELQVLKRHSQKVYASPSRRRMDTKGDTEEITYPYISFMVDNFEEAYNDIVVRDGEMVCVELLASDRDKGFQAVLFLGSIRYDALKRVYDSRASIGSKMAQRMTFGFFSASHSQRVEYVRMRGPNDKGQAEVAVSKPKGAGVETPTSEPGFSFTDGLWDSDTESDSEDMFKHHRRMSDPSSNLNNYSRSWKSKRDASKSSTNKRSRSQSDGLEQCGLAEIEAGDVRDESGGNSTVWSCCGCCDKFVNRHERKASCAPQINAQVSSPADCPSPLENIESHETESKKYVPSGKDLACGVFKCVSFEYSQPIGFEDMELKTMQPKEATLNLTTEKGRRKRFPLPSSDSMVIQSSKTNLSSMNLFKAPVKSGSVACISDAKRQLRNKYIEILPSKLSVSGVRIFYLCDMKLDDGAYNPLWSMRGFTQSFHLWRESRRAQSVPLNAFVTFVTLPCCMMMKDILDTREQPVLTF